MTLKEIKETTLCYLKTIGGMQAHCFTCDKKTFCNNFAMVVLRYKKKEKTPKRQKEEKLPL